MFLKIAGIITPVFLIILVGWLYGRKAHPDMAGINKATIEVIAPLFVITTVPGNRLGQFVLPIFAGALTSAAGAGAAFWSMAGLLGLGFLAARSN